MTVRSQAGLRNSAKPSSQAFLPLLHTWEHIWIIHLSDSSDSWKLEQSTYESQPAGCRKELSFKALLKKKIVYLEKHSTLISSKLNTCLDLNLP